MELDISDAADSGSFQNGGIKRKRQKTAFLSKKRKKSFLNVAPTAEELSSLREAETTFHSHLFKMQVEETLKELRDSLEDESMIMSWLEDFKQQLTSIPETSPFPMDDFSLADTVQIPILQKPKNGNSKFKFVPPSDIKIIGGYVLDTLCSSTAVVDISVEIPKACWSGMDFLNHRYHRKRAFYLAYIANALVTSTNIIDMKFAYQHDCHLKPVLLITPKGLQTTSFCLTAFPSGEAFKVARFLPTKNNVRTSWYFGTEKDAEEPTPHYNASILSDLLLSDLNDFLKENITSQSIKDGIILLKLWCLQRGLAIGFGRLTGFLLSMLVAYLLQKKKINSLMSSYQIFRCCLLALRTGDLTDRPISLCKKTEDAISEDFQNAYDVVFLDPSGCLNLAYEVSKETVAMVKNEATLGLQILDMESPTGFNNLFMNKISFSEKFEYLLHMNSLKMKKYMQVLRLNGKTLDFGGNNLKIVIPKICDLLRRGLNIRISLLDVQKLPHPPWCLHESPPNPNEGQISLGFLLNPETPLNNLERGPLADDPEAKSFRNFWGERSELRRFQDGTIREAVFWPVSTIAEKRTVFFNIVKDILKRHLNAEKNLVYNGTEVDCVLQLPDTMLSAELPAYGTGEEKFETVMQSFNTLCKQLRSLKGLPLLIASIQGSCPALRYSEVFPPLSVTGELDKKICVRAGHVMKLKGKSFGVPPYTPALEAIISLEGSGKWPDDVEGIKRVKAAFHLKIAELLQSQCYLTTSPRTTHADVYKDGFVFRLKVASHKEIFLMKQRTVNGNLVIRDTKESMDLEISTEILPKLNSVLHGLHQQHNSYGTACRLAKRWISAQLKSGFLEDITVELLVAYLFIHPQPYSCPSSPQVAFIRFLNLLITHDWSTFPVIVNLNNEFSKEELDAIYSTFTSQRSSLPPMVVVTPFDKRGSMWTKNMPPPVILKRIIILAKASFKTLDCILNNGSVTDIKSIFRPPLESFDVLIYLKRSEISKLSNALDVFESDDLPLCKQYKRDNNELFPIVDFDPVQEYLKELRENFGEFAFFLHDTYGGDFIAVVWKRSSFIPKELTVSRINYRTLNQDRTKIIPDVERILEDFSILGDGIIKKIVKQTDNWKLP